MPCRCAGLDLGPEHGTDLEYTLHIHGKSHLLVMLRALGQPGVTAEIGQTEVLVVAGDGGSYEARRVEPMEAVRAEELDNQLAHPRVELEDGSGGGVPHVEDAVVEAFLEPKRGQLVPVERRQVRRSLCDDGQICYLDCVGIVRSCALVAIGLSLVTKQVNTACHANYGLRGQFPSQVPGCHSNGVALNIGYEERLLDPEF